MPNNNVAILSIMSKFDEKSAREAAQRANKVYDEALSDIGNVNFDKKLLDNFDKAMNLLKNKFKKVNLSSYTNNLLDSIFSDKDIATKSKDIESFIKKIDLLKKASSGQDINAFNTFSAKQIEALISRTEKLAQKQDEINEKTREYNREATKIAKTNRSISTIDKNYGNQDYTRTLESLKKSLGTEKEFTAEQNQSIENLAKMVNLYQVMEKSEPQKGTAEAIRYSKDLLAVTQKIKEERDKIDAFSQKGASAYITNNDLSSIDKVSDYTVNKAKDDFTKASLSNLKAQEAKLQSELTTYISDSVQKNLAKVSKEADAVIDKAEKRVENLQNKIDSLQSKPNNTVADNSLIGNIVSESDVKSLEEIEDRLYAISDLDAEGEATSKQLKEYIQLYKQYEQLISGDSTVKFDPSLKEEYDSIIESDGKLKKYADTLDETIVKQKELNATKSDEKNTSTSVETEQLVKQEEQIKQTVQAEEKLIDTQNQLSSNTKISVDAEQAIADINKVKKNLESIPDEKKIKISVNDNDYTNTPLLSDAEGNTITAFRGVVGAWSGLINQDGIGFFTDKLKLAADYADSLAESGKVYQANLSFKNPLEVEGNGAKWDEIDFNGVKKTTDEIVELAKQLGHDGVIFKNIRDGFTDTEEDISNVMVALNASQIKNEQVIGTVKAGTGEMIDVANKINSATDTATNSTVESQNKIQEELKETQKVAEQVSEAMSNVSSDKSNISSGMKDVIQGDDKSITDVSTTAIKEESKALEQVSTSAKEASESKEKFAKANKEVKASAESSSDSIKEETDNLKKLSESDLGSMDKQIAGFKKSLENFKVKPDNGYSFDSWKIKIQELNSEIQKYQSVLDVIKAKGGIVDENDEAEIVRIKSNLEDLVRTMSKTPTAERGYTDIGVDKAMEKVQKVLDDNTKMSRKARLEIKGYYNELRNAPTRPIQEILDDMYKVVQLERDAGRLGKSWLEIFNTKKLHSFLGQAASMFSFYDLINLGRQGFQTIRELDTALTEMRKVSDESVESLKRYQAATFDVGDAVGATAKTIQNSTADWMRLGESIDEAAESAKTANILLNVSEFDSIDEATKSLVSMSQAYQELEKIDIVDKLNNIGNNYSIATDELATGLQNAAAVLKTQGNDLDKAIALVTAGNAITQDASKTSAGIRTIALRIAGTEEAKEELQELGEDVDDFVVKTASKTQQIIKDYTSVASNAYKGVDVLDANGNLRDTYDILLDIAKVYKEIQAEDKKFGTNRANALVEELAGKNRSNIASSILLNPDLLENVYKSSQNSAGSAQAELNKYLDSIDGRMTQLENRAQEFWYKVIDSDTIKNGITLLTNLLELGTDIVDTFGVLPTIMTGIGAGLAVKNVGINTLVAC